jgi:hypothetical protein
MFFASVYGDAEAALPFSFPIFLYFLFLVVLRDLLKKVPIGFLGIV